MSVLQGILLAVASAVGYGLGRWRPWARLGDWAALELATHLMTGKASPRRQVAISWACLLTGVGRQRR